MLILRIVCGVAVWIVADPALAMDMVKPTGSKKGSSKAENYISQMIFRYLPSRFYLNSDADMDFLESVQKLLLWGQQKGLDSFPGSSHGLAGFEMRHY